MDNKPSGGNPLKVVGMFGAIGVDIAVFMFAGYAGGRYLERLTDSKWWTVAGVAAGFFLGVTSVVLIVKRFLEGSDG